MQLRCIACCSVLREGMSVHDAQRVWAARSQGHSLAAPERAWQIICNAEAHCFMMARWSGSSTTTGLCRNTTLSAAYLLGSFLFRHSTTCAGRTPTLELQSGRPAASQAEQVVLQDTTNAHPCPPPGPSNHRPYRFHYPTQRPLALLH